MNFEQAFQRLDEIVQRLEQGDLALEESLALYEEGMTLAAQCNEWLDAAELRVRQLVPARLVAKLAPTCAPSISTAGMTGPNRSAGGIDAVSACLCPTYQARSCLLKRSVLAGSAYAVT
ncbi:MAG: exodeoxyribonuclease VII small subunit [Anaerolineae bacterium]|nr:MAG: exodeoxyribonuclease VII small subunit [Anaerolineae bacterium]